MDHAAIEECAVIAVPDPVRDEAVMAIVRLRGGANATPEEIVEHCRARMAKFKVPSHVRIQIEDFPKTSIGKIKKNEMKAEVLRRWNQR